MNEHLSALHTALRAEQAAESSEHTHLDSLSLDEQLAHGHAWPILEQRDATPDGRRLVLQLFAPKGVVLHEGISAGDPIWLERGKIRVQGTVEQALGRQASIFIDGRAPDSALSPGQARVIRRHDPSTLVRYRIALERADKHSSPLKDALLAPERAPPLPRQPADEAQANLSQRHALAHALQSPSLAVIWGPPGTGKTWLLARLLARLVARGERTLALADSNAATDHLALSAAEQGLSVVRLGSLSRIGAASHAMHIEAHIERGLYGPALVTLARDLRRSWGKPGWSRIRADHDALYEQARSEVLANAQVIAVTFGTLARMGSEIPPAVTAVVDEATAATEPAVWTVVPHVERLVLAGDPAQLGPVVHTPGPLGTSLLQRLIDSGAPTVMLEEQHRMAEPLRTLVSSVYGPRYTESPSLGPRPSVFEQHALWIDTAATSGELRDPLTASLYEPLEIEILALIAQKLIAGGISPAEIGVIAPYSAQVSRLSDHSAFAGIEVATVNAFQGRERDVILASFVRSNPRGELGFVADERRLTVALTRARRQLVIVGDSATLSVHPRFAALHDTLSARGAVQTVWEPPYDAVWTTR